MIKKYFNKLNTKENISIIIITVILSIIINFPLLTKNILTADVLLNNYYYNAYNWEISLGRFGLFITGIIKNFLVIKHIDLFISFILLGIITVIIIDIFKIKNKVLKLLTILTVTASINISSTLLFTYCNLSYIIAFLTSLLSSYILIKENNKTKYLISIILLIISESIYQSYISVSITLLIMYYIKKLIKNDFNLKEFIKNISTIIIGMIIYFIIMKISLVVFNTNLSNYSSANSFGIKNILSIKDQIINTYITFYNYYFKDTIIKNTYLKNNILNIFLLSILIISIIYNILKEETSLKNIIIIIIFLTILPISLNFILLIISDTKMQPLMSTSYVLMIPFILSLTKNNNNLIKYLVIILTIILTRNYIIQISATYQTLETTYNKTYKIAANIVDNINELGYDKKVLIAGNLNNNKYYNYNMNYSLENVKKLNYGFISNSSLFWNEYVNIKNGWTRFMYEYLGTNIDFVDEEKYNEILEKDEFKEMKEYPNKESIKLIDDVIVIKLN